MGRYIEEASASVVKNIQEVSKTIGINTTSNSTITAVDLAKTVLVTGGFQNPASANANAGVSGRTYGWSHGIRSDLTSTTNVQFLTNNHSDSSMGSRSGTVNLFVLEYV